VNKFDASTLLTSQGKDYQIHVIGKAIRPLFTDLVTFCKCTALSLFTWLKLDKKILVNQHRFTKILY